MESAVRTIIIAIIAALFVPACANDGPDTDESTSAGESAAETDDRWSATDTTTTTTSSSIAPSTRNGDVKGPNSTVPASPGEPVDPWYEPGDIDPGLLPFVDRAITDLAERLGVQSSSITTRAAVLVVWPDTSLGCPQPDMRYAQVPTDGSVIELDVDGVVYRYHTGGQEGPFLCDDPPDDPPPAGDLEAGLDSDR